MAEVNMVRRGPTRSTHLPNSAELAPRKNSATLKISPTWSSDQSPGAPTLAFAARQPTRRTALFAGAAVGLLLASTMFVASARHPAPRTPRPVAPSVAPLAAPPVAVDLPGPVNLVASPVFSPAPEANRAAPRHYGRPAAGRADAGAVTAARATALRGANRAPIVE